MRRFTALRAAVCALVALLASSARAQAVRDSVEVTVVSAYDEIFMPYNYGTSTPGVLGNCDTDVISWWPDVLADQGVTGSYTLVPIKDTGGFRLLGIGGYLEPAKLRRIPKGFKHSGSNAHGNASFNPAQPNNSYPECARQRAVFQQEEKQFQRLARYP